MSRTRTRNHSADVEGDLFPVLWWMKVSDHLNRKENHYNLSWKRTLLPLYCVYCIVLTSLDVSDIQIPGWITMTSQYTIWDSPELSRRLLLKISKTSLGLRTTDSENVSPAQPMHHQPDMELEWIISDIQTIYQIRINQWSKHFVLSIIKIQSTRKVKYTNKRTIFFLFELQGYRGYGIVYMRFLSTL